MVLMNSPQDLAVFDNLTGFPLNSLSQSNDQQEISHQIGAL